MLINEISELLKTIEKIKASTLEGKMEWLRINPTTLVWESKAPALSQPQARIVIQQIRKLTGKFRTPEGHIVDKIRESFLFQVIRMPDAVEVIRQDGLKNNDLNEALRDLYNVISTYITRKELDFLDSILPEG